jgi:hypothetical protein
MDQLESGPVGVLCKSVTDQLCLSTGLALPLSMLCFWRTATDSFMLLILIGRRGDIQTKNRVC